MKARQPDVVGIDVSKATLMVSSYGVGRGWRHQREVGQDDASIAELVKTLVGDRVRLVAVESTGGYELRILKALHAAGIGCARLSPELVKAFAKSQSKRAKTDAIDCEVIAGFASVTEVEPWAPVSDDMEQAIAMFRRRDAFIRERTREKNRLEHATLPDVRAMTGEHIAYLTKAAKQAEKVVMAAVKADPDGAARYAMFLSVPGVGVLTAARLVAELPELGFIGRRKIASLSGLAPMNKDSGEVEGTRKCAPGRRRIRTALFQAAHSAVQFNPVLRETYHRLMARGKPRKVVLIACARKLLVILTAMVRNDEMWDPERHPTSPPLLEETEVRELDEALIDFGIEPANEAEQLPEEPTAQSAPAKSSPKPTRRKAASKKAAPVRTGAKPTARPKRPKTGGCMGA